MSELNTTIKTKRLSINPDYFRNIIFGAEDSLVSTVGVLFGVAAVTANKNLVVVTGLIVIAVEALSMGAGSFLSEESTHAMDKKHKHTDLPWVDGLIMFASYFSFGFIPLAPYIFMQVDLARYASLAVTLVTLFILGYFPTKSFKAALRMATVAGLAALIGFAIASAAQVYI
jgi:VIT1/CCC1 family predicted Fe2+/Mn2+ transporter